MDLTTVWFVLIAVLWTGYFVLEGFDFGVGILLPVLGRDDAERRAMINTIGPVWDGNEVWLIVAGGATFAAFPQWYATLFSGFYLPLFVILVALIVRGVGFEFRGKRPGADWRRGWDTALTVGSLLPALLWGVAFANLVRGVPLDSRHEFVGSLVGLLNPYALLGGLTTLGLFTVHGSLFLALRTTGELRDRAHRLATRLGPVVAVVAVGFLVWTLVVRGGVAVGVCAVLAAVAYVGGLVGNLARRDGWAFLGTAVALVLVVATLFVALFPDVMPSSLSPAWSLTTTNAASTAYTLRIMTVVALVFTPIVVLYQAWSYHVFRKRIGVESFRSAGSAGSAGPAGSAGSAG